MNKDARLDPKGKAVLRAMRIRHIVAMLRELGGEYAAEAEHVERLHEQEKTQ